MKTTVDCLIISTGRAASTAVYKYLSKACNLNLPVNKEPHHWFDISKYRGLYPLLDQIYIKDRQEYFNLYATSSKIIDASCGYFYAIEEVIENLRSAKKMPKVVFLYRDPVSRASSIFNEWKRKELTTSKNVIHDVINAQKKGPGFWWEYYYDNVFYMDQFNLMKDYFSNLLLVNYNAFSNNPSSVFLKIAAFIGVPIVKTIPYTPVNSSVEVKILLSNSWLMNNQQFFPLFFQRKLKKNWSRKSKIEDMKYHSELPKYLLHSITQYNEFRHEINDKDVLCINK